MELPLLDCHAHVSPSVTDRQLAELGQAIVFAVTRDPAEAAAATRRYDTNLLWGCGAHPSFVARGGSVDLDQFAHRTRRFAVVGEIGLDRRSGNLQVQQEVVSGILDRIRDEPVLISVHSAGCTAETLELLREHRRPGLIMHWFTGSRTEADYLLSLGCYFSVNTAMHHELLQALPLDRTLPETDYPTPRKRTGDRPGDTGAVEVVLADIHGTDPEYVRRQFYRNLRRVSVETGAIDRMPAHVSDLLLIA